MTRSQQIWAAFTRPWLAGFLRERWLCRIVILAALVLGAAHLLGFSPWSCGFAFLTGLPCPGCGMTRAAAAALKGDWSKAMAFHPFVPAFMAGAVLVAFSSIASWRWREKVAAWVEKVERGTALATIILLFAIIYGLLRMGGLCSNHAVAQPPALRSWLQDRLERGGE